MFCSKPYHIDFKMVYMFLFRGFQTWREVTVASAGRPKTSTATGRHVTTPAAGKVARSKSAKPAKKKKGGKKKKKN